MIKELIRFISLYGTKEKSFTMFELYKESQKLLQLKNDWDDEGAKEIKEVTLYKALSFLNTLVTYIYFDKNCNIDLPKLLPSPDGNINIYFHNEQFELCIDIPEKGSIINIYGDNYSTDKIKGSFDLKDIGNIINGLQN